MSLARVVVSLPTADRRTSFEFYGEGLSFDAIGEPADDSLPEPLQFALNDGVRLMLIPTVGFGWVIGDREVAAPGQSECVFSLQAGTEADVDELVERAQRAGGEVVTPPGRQPWGYAGVFADPDGHLWMVTSETFPSEHQRSATHRPEEEALQDRPGMDYASLIKKLRLPPGFLAPARLTYEDLVARVLSRADLHDDVRGINASIGLIQRTRGGGWPAEPVTEEVNFVDLVWHELEFREATSFAYAVYDTDGGYLGCCYLYPMGRRTELSAELLSHDVDVSWWVTPDAYAAGCYEKLYRALRHWLAEEFPFAAPYYSNAVIPRDQG